MSPELTPFLFIFAVLVIFWLVVIRPTRTQQRKQQELQRGLSIGDQVVISAGIFGRVTSIDDDARARLEIAPGVEIEVARQVVVRRIDDEPGLAADRPDDRPDDAATEAPATHEPKD